MRQEGGKAGSGTDTVGESQGGRVKTVNRESRLVEKLGQVVIPAESRADVSAHVFWKRGTTEMFDIRIFNLNAGSYLRMTPEKDLSKAKKENKDLSFRILWSVEVLLLLWSTLRTEYLERRP